MSSLKIVAFNTKHLDLLEAREIEGLGFLKLPDAPARMERMAKDSEQSGTFIYDGRILFCAGYFFLWPGVIEVWMIPSIYVKDYPVVFYRTVTRYLKRLETDLKCHRVQTTSYADEFHAKWMDRLGFHSEGVMKKFTHDKRDLCLYARVN